MRHISKFAAVLFLAFTVAPSAYAKGDLANMGNFSDGTVRVDLDTYTDGPSVAALIGMKNSPGPISISFAFDQTEWPKLLNLWEAARAMTGSNFATAGSMTEVGSSAQCVITMAGGPGVRITIVDPTAGALVYVVNPSDEATFESDLRQIGESTTIVK